MYRSWAFWRRAQYIAGVAVLFAFVVAGSYVAFFYSPAACSDGRQNGDERGVDCGGACARICAFDVMPPTVAWVQAFRVTPGQYNAVAYVENHNPGVGTPELPYTFSLYDERGNIIATRTGITFLPPDGVYPIFEGRIMTGDKIPARTFLEIAPSLEWRAATAGRAQFEVQSRTLRDADSAPRLDTVIYNTSLEEEDDVEVIATIFDARGNALTSSQSIVPRFAGRAPEQVVFTWPEPIAKTVRSCEVPTDVILAIDLSGSMNNDGGTPPQPISSALAAADSFISLLRKDDRAGVVTYATGAALVQGLDSVHTKTRDVVRRLAIDPKEETGGTNIGDAIKVAQAEFATARHNRNARKVLVLLTDGKATEPGNDPEEHALAAAKAAREAGITIFTIGLGNGVDNTFLATIADDETHRFQAPTRADLDRIYRSVSSALCEEGAAVIDVVPKIPVEM
ncbi:VWA domain-containing protein [Candidatus Kaiserbacteria bacterium]|nr:VWA domain-containing protein [Candidatus Kaiserbacteria bacterium]